MRVTDKKRDDLQTVIAGLPEEDFGLPLQFENFQELAGARLGFFVI